MPISKRLFASLLILAGPLALRAGGPPAAQFEGAIDVRAVDVEAVVTDAHGRRVPGLKAADFRLLVDGRVVPIDFFSEVREGETVQSSGEVAAAPGAPRAAVPAHSPAGTNYLVFIDEASTIAAQRDFVMLRLLRDLNGLGSADRMAIVAFDGRKLVRLIDWTAERAALDSAFKTAMLRPSKGISVLAERASSTNSTTAADSGAAAGSKAGDGQLSWMDIGPARRGVNAAAAALRGMSSPPGRKVLFILSGGWPVPPVAVGNIRTTGFLDVDPGADLTEFVRPLTDAANLLGYTLYPVDVPGLDPLTPLADPSINEVLPIGRFLSSDFDLASQAGMEQMAKMTGGKAILNSARLDAFERTVADTRSYYGLGFTPDWRADGGRHDIELKVLRPGLRVRARRDFSDLAKPTEVALRNESLLLFGGGEESRRLRLTPGAPQRAGIGKVAVPLTVDVPVDALTAFPAIAGTTLQGILSMQALDRWGKRLNLGMIQLRITGPREPKAGDFARYETQVRLPKGDQHLVVIVRDDAGAGEAWGALDLSARAAQ